MKSTHSAPSLHTIVRSKGLNHAPFQATHAITAACAIVATGMLRAADAAAPQASNLMDMSLDDLSKVQVNIASVTSKPIREQPAIVSVITENEIHASGARDLMDVLSLVPGFSFGEDCNSAVGAGFRGFWAYEGKILVLLDGIEVNEGLYGCVMMGDHYSAEQIKQIEIIRGPGSAMYGGNAELAVIRITTKGAEQNGGFATVRPIATSGRFGTQVDGNIGYTLPHDWRVSLGVSYDNFVRSNQKYVALDGTVIDMARNSSMDPYMINANVGWKDLDIRVIDDNYQFQDPTAFGVAPFPSPAQNISWRSFLSSAKYDLKPTEWLTISPTVTLRDQKPWWTEGGPGNNYELEYQQLSLNVPTVININENNNILAGIRTFRERSLAKDTGGNLTVPFGTPASQFFPGPSDRVRYDDFAGYAQYDLDTKWANFTFGGRYEHHQYAGGAFVPRAGVTKAWDKFHLKLLYDQAFRTPNIENIHQTLGGIPNTYELTTGYQLEAGYQFTKSLSLVGNLYYMRIKKPLAYTYYSATSFGYINGTPLSTYGNETELRYANEDFSAKLGYSYYQANEEIPFYKSDIGGLNLEQPAHKVSFSGTYHISKSLDLNLNGWYITERRAYLYPYATPAALAPELVLNTMLEYHWKSASIGAGIRNLLDEDLKLGQSYAGGNAPLPLLGRQYFLRLGYQF